MRARPDRLSPAPRLRVAAFLVVASGAATLGACGLSLAGLGPAVDEAGDAALLDGGGLPPSSSADGAVEGGGSGGGHDASAPESGPPSEDAGEDVAVDAAPTCGLPEAGPSGVLGLVGFTFAGGASYNENSDGKITLTNSDNDEAASAWYEALLPPVAGYDLSWSLRVGPDDTAGEGIAFAVLTASSVPGVGADGEGIGLEGVGASAGDGGALSGYGVIVDMDKENNDPTDLGTTTLKLVAMPAFAIVAEVAVPAALNDGNVYSVDVSWRAPSTLTATLNGPGGTPYKVTSSDPRLTSAGGYFGFTASTGDDADSHQEIAGITIADTCE